MAKKWLIERWETAFFPGLLACSTEAEVQQVCENELNAWRDRGLVENSLRVPLSDTRKEISLRVQGDLQAWSLKHLNFTEDQWAIINAPSQKGQAERLENQFFISQPDQIVEKAAGLLESPRWPDIAVGLLALTGRRLSEVLKVGTFTAYSQCSVLFGGQLKKRGSGEFPAYEIPTLCDASLIIAGVERLRTILDCTHMAIGDVAPRYNKTVAENASKHFKMLIPSDDDRLHAHVFRAVYTRIAVLYYCPINVADLHFLAYTQGHFDVNGQDEILHNYASEMNYNHYKIVDANGQIDGRQGIKLNMPGVEVLKCFQNKKEVTTTATIIEETAAPAPATRRPAPAKKAPAPAKKAPAPADMTPDMFVPADIVELIHSAMETSHQNDFHAFLVEALKKEAKFRLGVATRYADKDFSSMTGEKLKHVRHPDALNERTRRAIAAIAHYNDNAASPNDRWFINVTSVTNLTGGRFANTSVYFQAHQEEIDALNATYNLTARYNHKPTPIQECVIVE